MILKLTVCIFFSWFERNVEQLFSGCAFTLVVDCSLGICLHCLFNESVFWLSNKIDLNSEETKSELLLRFSGGSLDVICTFSDVFYKNNNINYEANGERGK